VPDRPQGRRRSSGAWDCRGRIGDRTWAIAPRSRSSSVRSRSCWTYTATTKIDKLVLVNNVFVNTMTQKGTVSQLLPVQATDEKNSAGALGLHL
jgi:hypothetical protein